MNKPIALCDRCDIVMSCLLDYDGILCRKNRTVEPTNADKIRAMTDEEMVEAIYKTFCHDEAGIPCPPDEASCDKYHSCRDCWLNWLKQEVNDGD